MGIALNHVGIAQNHVGIVQNQVEITKNHVDIQRNLYVDIQRNHVGIERNHVGSVRDYSTWELRETTWPLRETTDQAVYLLCSYEHFRYTVNATAAIPIMASATLSVHSSRLLAFCPRSNLLKKRPCTYSTYNVR